MIRYGTPPQPRLLRRGLGSTVPGMSRITVKSMLRSRFLLTAVPAFLASVPAHAATGTPLPEPSGLFLLGIGVAGVIVGRRFANRKD